ncbi:MAG: hypothetical protein A2Y20_06395 [Firmicutes bacterium GWF2_51_9]|nr:MAG: hypothetical protein A2Y20_06395 [Firmicutes bacterium GWF2_51_9]OGS59506.1 MAG: hypothetical protein A2Y19_11015 [Firmicutes bacterium GWE2_51_13]HAM63450.1 hypothetical protein [Erysipelotrichaceae bacterium]HBZ41131.1 hypothetical protein [Erysipelotrichaceae bacterium]
MLNLRQRRLLQALLNEHESQTIDFFAQRIEVSVRTLHKDLDEIERFVNGSEVSLLRKAGVGIKLSGSHEERQRVLNERLIGVESIDPLSTRLRRMKITTKLLNSKDGTSLIKLSEEFMVARTSIVADLEKIEEWGRVYALRLVRDRDGTRVVGNEKDIRHALAGLIGEFNLLETEEMDRYNAKSRVDIATQYRLRHLFPDVDPESVEEIILDAEKHLNYRINDVSYTVLLTHLLILIQRVRFGETLNQEALASTYDEIPSEIASRTASYISREIESRFQCMIPETEVRFIAMYLMCLGIQSSYTNLETQEYVLDIDDTIKETTRDIIERVSTIAQIDLTKDKPLYYGLMTHIKPMMSRLRYGILLRNPLLEQIKSQYSPIFSILYLLTPYFEEKFGTPVNDDELSYMAIHLQAALERCVSNKRVIIVCPEGIGFSRFLANRISRFVSSIEIVDIVSLGKLNKMDFREIDFIISTVPIKQVPIPVLRVSSLAGFDDIRNVNNFIIEQSFHKPRLVFESLKKVLDEKLILTGLNHLDRNEILNLACDRLESLGRVKSGFRKSVFHREQTIPTCLGNGIAIPHGKEEFVLTSSIMILCCDHDVDWGNGSARLMFLIAVNFTGETDTKEVLTDLYNVIDTPMLIQQLKNARNADEVLALFA